MRNTKTAIIVGANNYISAIGYVDERNMFAGAISVTQEKVLAPLAGSANSGQPLPEESVDIREFKHTDGNIYLVGVRPGARQDIDFESVIDFVKGDKSLPYRWM